MIYRLSVGRLSCAVISDGQLEPPWEPPLEAFFTADSGCQITSCEMLLPPKDKEGPR